MMSSNTFSIPLLDLKSQRDFGARATAHHRAPPKPVWRPGKTTWVLCGLTWETCQTSKERRIEMKLKHV